MTNGEPCASQAHRNTGVSIARASWLASFLPILRPGDTRRWRCSGQTSLSRPGPGGSPVDPGRVRFGVWLGSRRPRLRMRGAFLQPSVSRCPRHPGVLTPPLRKEIPAASSCHTVGIKLLGSPLRERFSGHVFISHQ